MFLALGIFFLLGYLIGSVNFAVLIAKKHGVDILKEGSGNPGATNVLRSGNKKAALFTLIGDALKGYFAVMLAISTSIENVAD